MTTEAMSVSPARPGVDDVLSRRHGENFRSPRPGSPAGSASCCWRCTRSPASSTRSATPASPMPETGWRSWPISWRVGRRCPPPPRRRSPAHQTLAGAGAPVGPMQRLVEANLLDQRVHVYASFPDLLGYCRLSADPVGRLVLWVMDVGDPVAERLSDAVCTGLQLAEHWQDVGEDHARGRIYLPEEDLAGSVVTEADVAAAVPSYGVSPRDGVRGGAGPSALLDEGLPLVRSLAGRFRLAIAGVRRRRAGGARRGRAVGLRRPAPDPPRPRAPGLRQRCVRSRGSAAYDRRRRPTATLPRGDARPSATSFYHGMRLLPAPPGGDVRDLRLCAPDRRHRRRAAHARGEGAALDQARADDAALDSPPADDAA